MSLPESNAKAVQLHQLHVLLERLAQAYRRYSESKHVNIYAAFNHPSLQGAHWREQLLRQDIGMADKAITMVIIGAETRGSRSFSRLAEDQNLDGVWQSVFWSSYCYANASQLGKAIETVRKRLGASNGFEQANAQTTLLSAKTETLRGLWRRGNIVDVFIQEILGQLSQLSQMSPSEVEAIILSPEQTWIRGLSVLAVSIDEYEALVDRYVQNVATIVAELSAHE